jgi:transposase
MQWCKACGAATCVKNGRVREQQRWLCKECGYNFVKGDQRKERSSLALKSLATLLCSLGLSFRLVARLFALSHSTVQAWFDQFAATFPSLDLPPKQVEEVEADEMRTFLHSKKTSFGLTRPLPVLVAVFDFSRWKWVVVTLPR